MITMYEARRSPLRPLAAPLLALLGIAGCGAADVDAQDRSCPDRFVDADRGAKLLSCAAAPEPSSESRSESPHCPSAADPRVRDLLIESAAMGGKPMKARVILPKRFEQQHAQRWPVLYLLTGHGASYESWTCDTPVRAFVEELDLLVVMPEGTVGYDGEASAYTPEGLSGLGDASSGVPGWYSDWLVDDIAISNASEHAPAVQMRIRTHHTEELRDLLNRNFRADNERYAVAGLSMGGYGALMYALASSEQRPWVAAASFSGVLDTELVATDVPILGTVSAATIVRGSIEIAQAAQGELWFTGNRLWGEASSTTWREHNPARLVAEPRHALTTMPLYVSAGQGSSNTELDIAARVADYSFDPLESGAYLATRSFLAALARADANLTTEFLATGGHNFPHWSVNLCHALASTLLAPLGLDAAGGSVPSCPRL
jgi:S-formylglutathione hydrolase FrmB